MVANISVCVDATHMYTFKNVNLKRIFIVFDNFVLVNSHKYCETNSANIKFITDNCYKNVSRLSVIDILYFSFQSPKICRSGIRRYLEIGSAFKLCRIPRRLFDFHPHICKYPTLAC